MRWGLDYSAGFPGAAAIKAAGASFVVRYLSTPGNPKNITADEAKALKAAGIAIAFVFETTANRALAGFNAGMRDAQNARAQARAVRAVGFGPIAVYFAVDFDATPAEQAALNAYLKGAASVLGHDNTGVYGDYYVVKRALEAGVCKLGWQTEAWSGHQWYAGAHIRQMNNDSGRSSHVGGVAVDWNVAMVADFGQTPRPKPAPKPVPVPVPVPPPTPAPVPVPAPFAASVWGYFKWRDAGADPNLRPAVSNPVPLAWVWRYWVHRGSQGALPKRVRDYLNKRLPV